MSVSSVIKSIQDIMRKDAGVDGDAQRLGQLSWLLFLKVFDAQEEALELEMDDYQSPIPEDYLWRNWAADDQGITGDEQAGHFGAVMNIQEARKSHCGDDPENRPKHGTFQRDGFVIPVREHINEDGPHCQTYKHSYRFNGKANMR